MDVLIVASNADLSELWASRLRQTGARVFTTVSEDIALEYLAACRPDVIVLDLTLKDGSALAVADYASYRWPATRLIFTTDTGFFRDGSAFRLNPNAAAFLGTETPPDDLAAIVEYHARAS